jgi:F0F1-type ATP synthase gamma subunit
MATLLQLRSEIQFNGTLSTLLSVLKSVATQQFQLLERRFKSNQAFYDAVLTVAGTLDLAHMRHPFVTPGGAIGVIAVTSDTGLLGGLNRQVMATAAQLCQRQGGELIIIGGRGVTYNREYGLPYRAFPGVQDESREDLATKVREYAMTRALARHFRSMSIVYPRALSFSSQKVDLLHVLPCQAWLKAAPLAAATGMLLESSPSDILEYAVWMWLGHKLTDVFGHARLAELGARAMHLEGSSQELQQRGKRLQLKYFRKRHEVIDASMRELFAAKTLFKG